MNYQIPASELKTRMDRFLALMDQQYPEWEMAVVFNKINLLYFTGTMPEGMLLITRGKSATLWARRSYERAMDESLWPDIRPMNSYRDAAATVQNIPNTIYLETEFVPLSMFKRFQKHFPFTSYKSLDTQISAVRSVKSLYELKFMEEAGHIHKTVLEDKAPALFREGMSEVDLAGDLYKLMLDAGHQGTARFAMFDTEIVLGHIAFGESSIYPTSFNGPGGNYGMCPAVPVLGNRERKLKKGDLIFIDVAVGVNGYHSDKTVTYMFGQSLDKETIHTHQQCVDVQNKVADMLRPGNIPSAIFETTMNDLSPDFLENFMGFGSRKAKFLGHGIGLTVDEFPVIAKGFDEPLQENMVFALEPKKGIKGVGMVGIENTFVVTNQGGRCISGDNPGLILIEK